MSANAPSAQGGDQAKEQSSITPKLFQPLRIRGLEIANRIVVSPMGMYSAQNGHLTDFHLMHIGNFAFRGAALTIMEVSAITANGRTSQLDAGLWNDSQIEGMKRVVNYVHSLDSAPKIGLQIGHSGRKGSMHPVYPGSPVTIALKEEGGWPDDVWGASSVPFLPNYIAPKEMTQTEIDEIVAAFADTADRAVQAGFDLIEIHAAHGYLLSSFLSPCSNIRTDSYGGSFENRIRLLMDVVNAVRARIPDSMPLSVRISATDWMEHEPTAPQWTLQESIDLTLVLADIGVDVIDVSSGSNNALQRIPSDTYYQVNLAQKIKEAVKSHGKSILVAAVGRIDNAAIAREVLEDEKADVVLVAKQFLRDPSLALNWAEDLGLETKWPRQYMRLNNIPVGAI